MFKRKKKFDIPFIISPPSKSSLTMEHQMVQQLIHKKLFLNMLLLLKNLKNNRLKKFWHVFQKRKMKSPLWPQDEKNL